MTDKIYPVMERGSFRQSAFFGDHQCPVECVTKLLLFVAVTTLVLYIPLGKLTMYCEPSRCASPKASTPIAATNDKNVALCCLCDVYRIMLHVGRATSDAVELAVFVTLDILYEAKLQFYHLLEMVDRNDLCRSVCCRDEVRQNGMPEKRSCRCVKSKMCKYTRRS